MMGDTATITIRIPAALKEKIAQLAEEDCRTLNNMVSVLLTRSVKEWEQEHQKHEAP